MAANTQYIVVLAFCALGGIVGLIFLTIHRRRLFSFSALMLLNYVIILPVSGIAHLSASATSDVGFYDLRTTPELVEAAVLATALGLAALSIGLFWKLPAKSKGKRVLNAAPMSKAERKILFMAVAILIPLGAYGTYVMQGYASTLGQTRIIEVSGGYARYTYISYWLVWGISLGAGLLVSSKLGKNRVVVVLILILSVTSIAASLAWTGGRSIVPTMALPISVILFSRLRGERRILSLIAILMGFFYAINQSVQRLGSWDSSTFIEWLDWQWGRFSMLGWARNEIDESGLMWGETFAASYTNLVFGALRLIGIAVNNPDRQSLLTLSSESILRDRDAVYVVPGIGAELLANFGYVGMVGGMFLLGIMVNWVDIKFEVSNHLASKLLLAYIGSLLVLRTLAADSGSLPAYLLYSGFPLILMAALSFCFFKNVHTSPSPRSLTDQSTSSESINTCDT